mgnify:CR=1 FL=1
MEIKYIEPSVLHDEMLRLRKEKQMDFLESVSYTHLRAHET